MCRPGLGREGWDKWDRRHHLNNLGTGGAGDHSPTTSCFQLDIPLWKFCYMHEYSGVLWMPVSTRLHWRPHREMYGREWVRAGHHVRRECQVPQHTRLLQVFLSTRIWGRWERVVQQLVTLNWLCPPASTFFSPPETHGLVSAMDIRQFLLSVFTVAYRTVIFFTNDEDNWRNISPSI